MRWKITRGGGKKSHLARAVGLHQWKESDGICHIIDATGGSGEDAFWLASMGAKITLLERVPAIHQALQSALEEAAQSDLAAIAARITLRHADSAAWLAANPSQHCHAITIDPMFPDHENRRAAPKKTMQELRHYAGNNDDADALLQAALNHPAKRVIVKRPRHAEALAALPPHHSISGKANRFDVYLPLLLNN